MRTIRASDAEAALLRLVPGAGAVATSATLNINEAVAMRRAEGRETIHLGFGRAAFPLHPALREALHAAAAHTGYAPVLGIPALRQAIAAYLSRTRGVEYDAEQIVVGPGSKPLLYALLHVLDGDLLLPVPSWVSYAPMARLAGRRVIGAPTDADDHHRLTPESLVDAVARARREGAEPRLLLVNSPSNPTGGMFARADVGALAGWAREAGMTLISDEVYAELAHGWRAHVSPSGFYPEGTIVTGGLSKAFSAGGWRLGYAALPPSAAGGQTMAALRALASEIWSSAATPIQEAALAAYTPNEAVERYVRHSALVHGYVAGQLHETLRRLGVLCARPAGGFYLYADFAPWRRALAERGIATSDELAHYLLDHWDVATLPGTVFGEEPPALRLRLSTSLLCEPEGTATEEERAASLWRLLDQAEILESTGAAEPTAPALPALACAQARFTEVIQDLQR